MTTIHLETGKEPFSETSSLNTHRTRYKFLDKIGVMNRSPPQACRELLSLLTTK